MLGPQRPYSAPDSYSIVVIVLASDANGPAPTTARHPIRPLCLLGIGRTVTESVWIREP